MCNDESKKIQHRRLQTVCVFQNRNTLQLELATSRAGRQRIARRTQQPRAGRQMSRIASEMRTLQSGAGRHVKHCNTAVQSWQRNGRIARQRLAPRNKKGDKTGDNGRQKGQDSPGWEQTSSGMRCPPLPRNPLRQMWLSLPPLACSPLHVSQLLYPPMPCNPLHLSSSGLLCPPFAYNTPPAKKGNKKGKRKQKGDKTGDKGGTEGREGEHNDQQEGRQEGVTKGDRNKRETRQETKKERRETRRTQRPTRSQTRPETKGNRRETRRAQ